MTLSLTDEENANIESKIITNSIDNARTIDQSDVIPVMDNNATNVSYDSDASGVDAPTGPVLQS